MEKGNQPAPQKHKFVAILIFFLVFFAISIVAAYTDTDTANTGMGTFSSSGSKRIIKWPVIWQGKLQYYGESKEESAFDSTADLLSHYSEEELHGVTELYISSARILRIEGLNRLPNLKILRLGNNRITAISGLQDTPLLEIINLSQNRVERIEGLESLPNLRELHLSNNRIERIEGLDSLEKLEVLMLEGNQITEISGLGRLPALRRLGLAGNRLRDVDGLLELGDLNDLSIRSLYNQLDDKALETIAEWNRRHADNPFVQL